MSIEHTTATKRNDSILELFKESWAALSKHALSFVILGMLSLVAFVGIGFIAMIAVYSAGFDINLFRTILSSGPDKAFSSVGQGQWVFVGSVLTVSMVVYSIINMALHLAMIIVAGDRATSIVDAFKKGLSKIVPAVLAGILTTILLLGSFFLFVVPAFILAFFLIFVQYEIVLNGKTPIAAVKRSISLVAHNFGYVFLRVAAFVIAVVVLVVFIPNIMMKIDSTTSVYIGFYSMFANMVLGWYGVVYFITLYLHINAQQEETSVAWVYIVSIIGWCIAVILGFVGYKLLDKQTLKNMTPNNKTVHVTSAGEKIYLDKSQKIFDKIIARNQSITDSSDQESIQQLIALSDQNITVLIEGVKKYPKSASLWYQLGNSYTWLSSVDGALEHGLTAYQKAEKLEPKYVPYINSVGDMLIRLGRNDEAVLQFQKTLRITKKSGYAYLSLAQAYRNLKVYTEARKNYKLAIEVFTTENTKGTYDKYILQAQQEMAAMP